MGLRDNVNPAIATLSVLLILVVTVLVVIRAAMLLHKERQAR
ncbi:hypothetical protein SAMN04488105_107186 [Salipiger thiooxidans]|uniref:Uncharacterized protein n=1 Tax=Salipiger thiooxidans TaxID=282683 RepID=A0A1G7FMW2_9RHOB|nr:hypothetical protein [Salipiger thiooxidans]SDE77287.1 hypothetical protein SAMN04488105_107186 [Salipiger thiooxidans]